MKQSENILVVGLGDVGRFLARRLSWDGHAVTVIEQDRDVIARAEGDLDVRFVMGDALDFASWDAARAQDMDYLIAVTDYDAVNILSAKLADRFGIKKKICRVRSLAVWEDNAPLRAADLHIDLVIRPGELAAQEIARFLSPKSVGIVNVGKGELQVISNFVRKGDALVGKTLRELDKDTEFKMQVVSVARDIETIIPDGNFVIQEDDHLYMLAPKHSANAIIGLTGPMDNDAHNILMVGGGRIGARTAELLQDKHPVRLIERDEFHAEALGHRLKKTQCLHGDGADGETMMAAGLMRMDTIITATGDNETNIMSVVLAKHLIQTKDPGRTVRTIAMVNREEYLTLATAMGADTAVSAKILASNAILRYIRRGHVLSVAHLHGCEAEMVELLADPGSMITSGTLASLDNLRGKFLVGAVYRNGEWQLAHGDTHIGPHERVVCICKQEHLRDLQRMFLK